MNVFIDLGAYNGDSVKDFLKKRKLPKPADTFKIYAFEPNPYVTKELTKTLNSLSNDFEVSTAAAWIKDEILDMSVDNTATPIGSSIMPSKQDYHKFNLLGVQCFDFSKWIKRFKDDFVIVKMDIEGAEFEVLNKMMHEGTHKIMDQLWLETHPNKVKDYTTQDSDKLFRRLEKDIYVERWG